MERMETILIDPDVKKDIQEALLRVRGYLSKMKHKNADKGSKIQVNNIYESTLLRISLDMLQMASAANMMGAMFKKSGITKLSKKREDCSEDCDNCDEFKDTMKKTNKGKDILKFLKREMNIHDDDDDKDIYS